MIAQWKLIAHTYLFRGAGLWLLARILISVMMSLAELNPLTLSARSSALIVLVATVLGFAQTGRLREHVLLGNLGVSRAALALCFALPALAGELIIGIAGARSW
jgi:hypothetical protein